MTKDIGVIPAPEHRSPGAPIGVTEIGTVTNLDGTERQVGVNGNLVTVDGPLELLGSEAVKLSRDVAAAIRAAALYEGQNSSSDGGCP